MRRALMALLAASVIALAGCGGGGGGGGGDADDAPAPGGNEIGEGQRGGAVTFLSTGDVDSLDPAQTYIPLGYMLQYAVNRQLYSFAPDEPLAVEPDLAATSPEISADDKTITVHLKRGIEYAPPVNREVRAADVKYAIERAFSTSVPSPYARTYFGAIEGAPKKPVSMVRLKSFSGLMTPDDNTLVIRLTEPVAHQVAAALAMPITTPVPREYARRFDQSLQTTYDQHVAFTGPYMVRNSRKTGLLTGHQPLRRIELVRNPNWDRDSDYRPAFLDRITVFEGAAEPTSAARRTLEGKRLLCCNEQPSTTFLERARKETPEQLAHVTASGTRWVALNTTRPPFDDPDVRKAVVAGMNREALREARGGEVVGPVAQSFLPPGITGHQESGGEEGFDDVDFMAKPGGDAATFKRYMLRAAERGVPVDPETGRYTGKDKVSIIGENAQPGLQVARVVRRELGRLGFKTSFRVVPRDQIYAKWCGVPAREPDVCPNVGWFKDFADPASMLRPTFDGSMITKRSNANWSQLAVPEIDEAMAAADLLDGEDRSDSWADVNRLVVEQAPGVPYLWDDVHMVQSKDVQGVMNGFYGTWDLNFTSVD